MATEFDPNRPDTRTDFRPRDEPLIERRRSPLGTIAALSLLTVAIIVGLMFWNGTDRTAMNSAPGVTAGSTAVSPSPSNSPPPAGPKG